MKIVVCVKETADTAASLSIVNDAVSWGEAALILNPWDEFAVEEALLLRERFGGEVIAVSVGADGPNEAIKTALAMGVDQAVLVSDPVFQQADPLQISLILASAIEKIGAVDLVLFGRQAVDTEHGVLPAQVARRLNLPALTQVKQITGLDPAQNSIQADRALDEGTAGVSASLPAVMSVVKGINEPRYPSFMGIRKAARAKVPVWNKSELELQEFPVVQMHRTGLSQPAQRETILELLHAESPTEMARYLLKRLREEKVI